MPEWDTISRWIRRLAIPIGLSLLAATGAGMVARRHSRSAPLEQDAEHRIYTPPKKGSKADGEDDDEEEAKPPEPLTDEEYERLKGTVELPINVIEAAEQIIEDRKRIEERQYEERLAADERDDPR